MFTFSLEREQLKVSSNPGVQLSSVQFSRSVVSTCLQPHESQHAGPPCPSPTPGVHPNPRSLSRWCLPTISSSVIPFSFCQQSFPASGFFSDESALCIRWPKDWSFSFSISPSNEYSGLISFRIDRLDSIQSKGCLGVFSNTIVQKHQFFGTQLSLWSNSHIHTWPLEKP